MKKAISLTTIFLLLTTMYLQVFSTVYASTDPYITMDLDKTSVQLGDIITATVRISNISKFSGYQINIKYDPTVLKAVTKTGNDYTKSTTPLAGDLLQNTDFNPYPYASNDLSNGVLNVARSYLNVEGYKDSGTDENTGSIAIIGFKVLKAEDTNITFENAPTMPNGITGTLLFDCNGNRIQSGYSIKQPQKIVAKAISTPTAAPTVVKTPTPTQTVSKTPTPTQTVAKTSTPTAVKTPIPTPTPTKSTDSYITINLDNKKPVVGDVIKASIKINNINNFSGYQVNIKYDPTILQPVNYFNKQAPFKEKSIASDGDLLVKPEYKPYEIAANDLSKGILNLNKIYTEVEQYRLDNKPEKTGVLGIVGFRVLKEGNTTIRFENTSTMPNAISGTMLFDWNANRIASGYTVIQPDSITAVKSTPTPTTTPTPTSTATPIPTPTGFQVNVGSDKGNYGDEVIVPVIFEDVPSGGITAADMTITYDKDKLKFISGEAGSIVTNPSVNFEINKESDGKLKVLILDYKMTNGVIKSDGLFAKLKFEVITSSNSISLIRVTNSTFANNNLKNIGVTITSGKVTMNSNTTTVAPTPKATISPTKTKSNTSNGTIQEPDNDIPAGAKTGVHKAYLKGYTDNCFRPKKEITRAEAAVIVAKFVTDNSSTTNSSKAFFSDVSNNHWAKSSIELVTKAGLFQGYPDGSFKPDDTIKRGEFATVVFKLLKLKESSGLSNNFTDIKNHWAKKYILELADLKYISGYSDGTFKPDNKIKREECVVLINRALGRGPLGGAKLNFTDVPETYWAFKDIAEGSLDHEYFINSKGEEMLKN